MYHISFSSYVTAFWAVFVETGKSLRGEKNFSFSGWGVIKFKLYFLIGAFLKITHTHKSYNQYKVSNLN